MKTTINKTITVLQKLTPKYTNLNTKLNEVILSEEESSTLNIKLDDILALVNGNSSSEPGLEPDAIPDLVTLGILPKPISEFTTDDIGTIISIPYNDESGKILLNNGCIEFEVVDINHHKDINDESKPTITLMTKNIIRCAAFDAKEPSNPDSGRSNNGNNRWSVSNIRQWLNSEGAANKWFTPQHEYDEAPTTDKVSLSSGAYADDPGFLAGFSSEIKSHFAMVRNKTILYNTDKLALSKEFEETEDKIFLPSYTEIISRNLDDNNPEGSHISKLSDNDSIFKSGATYNYWMRSPDTFDSYDTHYVSHMGYYDITYPYNSNGFGIAPLIVLC